MMIFHKRCGMEILIPAFYLICLLISSCSKEAGEVADRDRTPDKLRDPDADKKVCAPSYKHLVQTKPHNQLIHIIEANPQHCKLEIGMSKAAPGSGEFVKKMAEENNAVAAINAGMFYYPSSFFGIPKGYVRQNGYWISSIKRIQSVIAWSDSMDVHYGRLGLLWDISVDGVELPLDTIGVVSAGESALFGSAYARPAVTKQQHCLEFQVDLNYTIRKIGDGTKVLPVLPQGFVYSTNKFCHAVQPVIKVGASAIPRYRFIEFDPKLPKEPTAPTVDWEKQKNVMGALGLLVVKGEIQSNAPILTTFPKYDLSSWSSKPYVMSNAFTPPEKSKKKIPPLIRPEPVVIDPSFKPIVDRAPRSGFCTKPDGNLMFVVAEGRRRDSIGMTIQEFANLLKSLGCWNAIALDGGGSSSLFFEGKMMGSPPKQSANPLASSRWRKVPNILLLRARLSPEKQ